MPSRTDIPRDELIELAKRTLIGTVHNSKAPDAYIEELRKHVKFWKDDTLFRIIPQPRRGYGAINCLENGCEGVAIHLNKRTSTSNDGKRDGIGSLSAYRVHIQTHPTHRASRSARVKAEIGVQEQNAGSSDDMDVDTKTEETHAPLGTVDSNTLGQTPPTSISSSPTPKKISGPFLPMDLTWAIRKTQARIEHFENVVPRTKNVVQNIVELWKKLDRLRTEAAKHEIEPHNFPDHTDLQPVGGGDIKSFIEEPKNSTNELVPRPVSPVISGFDVQSPASTFERHSSPLPGHIPNYGDTWENNWANDTLYRGYSAHQDSNTNPGGIEKFIVDAGNSEMFDGNESVDKALQKLGLTKLGECLQMMTVPLMPHQVIGVAWMYDHEKSRHKGGILADEMGLGKTVQMISMMLMNRSDDPAVKSTLICAPLALLEQWKLEIDTKTESAFRCLIYHGANKPKKSTDLQKYDVVLTTFQTLALEWDDPRAKKRKQDKARKTNGSTSNDNFIETDSEDEQRPKKKGMLFKMSWYRVVLDEAQNIRNRNTRISNAVTKLSTKYRWCLTGTPVTNSLADGYGLLRFLEIRPWYDWEEFNGHVARIEKKRPDLASRRMQAIFNSCLLRRKKDSLLDGKRLIELPPKEIVIQELEFSKDERDIYNAVEAQSQATFNQFLRAGTVLKNYAHVLVLLLRLRQLCSHPCLIQEDGYAFVCDNDPTIKDNIQAEIRRATTLAGKEFVRQMKQKFKNLVLRRISAEKKSLDATIEDEECPICLDTPNHPVVTRCGHVFCADCVEGVFNLPAEEDGNKSGCAASERSCPACREPIQREMLFQRAAFEPSDKDLEMSEDKSSPVVLGDDEDGLPMDSRAILGKGKRKGKGKKRFSRQILDSDDGDSDEDDTSDFNMDSEEDDEKDDYLPVWKSTRKRRIAPDSDDNAAVKEDDSEVMILSTAIAKKKQLERFLPSTKMKEMMSLLKKWAEAEESKNEKTMVLSQWTSCLDLVADYLVENGFTFVRYQGDMNRYARSEAVKTFMSQGKARIMLMSLKCGGVGLNLTRANRVISLDLGWSTAVESQAFDRVHRLGQVRPVNIHRLVVAHTVEARILALQERKQNLADGSLGEGGGKKLGKLSVKDLANLFGLNSRGQLL